MARKREFDEVEALKQAMALFWVQGYEKTSMEDLVSHMGVHRKSIYDTFGNKHNLFLKVLEYYRTTVGEKLSEYLASEKTAIGKIQALFAYSMGSNKEQAKGCLVVNTAVELALHDEAIAQIVRTNFEETEKAIFQVLQQGQKEGEISADLNLEITTKFIHNTLIGIRVQLKTEEDIKKLQPIVDMTLAVIKNNLN